MVILTNLENFPLRWRTEQGLAGESRIVQSPGEFMEESERAPASVALINCNPRLVYELAARLILTRRRTVAVVAVDLVLRQPRSFAGRLLLPAKRLLLNRVDHFIHYFRDVRGYETVFGIGPARSSFVPFKANLAGASVSAGTDGEYVLCLGRTLRDFDTFFAAMERLPYPGAISKPNLELMRLHGSRFSRGIQELPRNVRILEDDGTDACMAQMLRAAKIVAIPILKESMAASGCSTCINAMLFGKCVVASEGPGFSDVFTNGELLCVPPEDATALAQAIDRLWRDNELREQIARQGQQYARWAGGEQELFHRLIEDVATWYCANRSGCANAANHAN